MKIKNLLANISLAVLLNALVKPVWVLVEIIVQNEVGHKDWGMYAGLLSFAFLFITLTDLGVNQFLTKTLASTPERIRELYPNFLSFKLILLVAYPLLMVGAGMVMGYTSEELFFLALLCLVWGGHQMTQFFRSNFQAMQRFRIDSIASVLDRVILLVLVGLLFLTRLDIASFVYARLIAAGLTMLIFFIVLSRLYGWLKPRLEAKVILPSLRMSIPFALITVLNSVHDKVDQVMLKALAGNVETGLYAAAYRWMDVFGMYLWTVLAIFFARFALYLADKKMQAKLLRMGQVVTALPMIFVCVFVFFYGEKLFWLYTDSTPGQLVTMEKSLKILFAATLVHSLFVIYGTLLSAANHERFVNIAITIGIIVNVGLNYFLIPILGAQAAALSTVASYTLMSLCYMGYMQLRVDEIPVPWSRLLKLILAAGLLYGCFFLLAKTALPWYVNTALAGVVYAGIGLGLGFLKDVRE